MRPPATVNTVRVNSKEEPLIPVKTSVEDIQKVLTYLARQVGWIEVTKAEKALGSLDDRKISAMVEFGLVLRDGGNLKATPLGQHFHADSQDGALQEVLRSVELYRATLEWAHYGNKSEITATEVGQYWEASHADTLGGLRGTTLKDGAVCFGRIVAGAGLGTFTLGRGGKETRITLLTAEVGELINGVEHGTGDSDPSDTNIVEDGAVPVTSVESEPRTGATPSEAHHPTVSVSTSPSVHVNVEIHIAADATSDTVREIFRNMARYVLDKSISDEST